MTEIDTTKEAVTALADRLTPLSQPNLKCAVCQAAATLHALIAEREALKYELGLYLTAKIYLAECGGSERP